MVSPLLTEIKYSMAGVVGQLPELHCHAFPTKISEIGTVNRADSAESSFDSDHISTPSAVITASTSFAEPITRKEISSESSLSSRSLIPNDPLSGINMETPYGPAARRTARTAAPPIRRGSTPLSDIFCPA